MNNQALIFGIAAFVVLIAIIFNDRVKAAFKGFSIGTDNRYKENELNIDGDENKVRQGTRKNPGDASEKNSATIKGKGNDVDQG